MTLRSRKGGAEVTQAQPRSSERRCLQEHEAAALLMAYRWTSDRLWQTSNGDAAGFTLRLDRIGTLAAASVGLVVVVELAIS